MLTFMKYNIEHGSRRKGSTCISIKDGKEYQNCYSNIHMGIRIIFEYSDGFTFCILFFFILFQRKSPFINVCHLTIKPVIQSNKNTINIVFVKKK